MVEEWSPKSCYFWQIMNNFPFPNIAYFLLRFGINYRCKVLGCSWKFQLSIFSGFFFFFFYIARLTSRPDIIKSLLPTGIPRIFKSQFQFDKGKGRKSKFTYMSVRLSKDKKYQWPIFLWYLKLGAGFACGEIGSCFVCY